MTNSLDTVLGSTVYGPDQQKIGKVKEIYLDNRNGYPTWASVSTGLFSSNSLVPLAGAAHNGDSLQVIVDKDAVKTAPHLDANGAINPQQEQELLRHYGVDAERAGWDTYGRHAAAGTEQEQATDQARTASGTEPLVRSEERLDISTETQPTGTAHLRKHVVTETETVEVPVSHEEVRVVREPITDPSSVRPGKLGEEDREVTLHGENVTVTKESVPVERVRLDVDTVEGTETVTESVRKERIETEGVERNISDERRH